MALCSGLATADWAAPQGRVSKPMALKKIIGRAQSRPGANRSDDLAKPPILYVEDENTNWEITSLSLSDRYHVTRAKNSQEAFDLISSRQFDVILMDIQLMGSDLSGIEITQLLKGLTTNSKLPYTKGITLKNTPIIFVTAYSARYTKQDLVQAGGDDLITKPVDFTRLTLAMSRLMVRKARDTNEQIQKAIQDRPESERRAYPRSRERLACTIEVDTLRLNAETTNLSPGGVKLVVDNPEAPPRLGIDREFNLIIEAIWGGVTARCRVVRVSNQSPYTIGAEFLFLPQGERDILDSWIFGTKD